MTVELVRLDPGTAALAAVAVRGYLTALDRAGRPAPPRLVALADQLRTASDKSRQTVAVVDHLGDDATVNLDTAARLLGVSRRTVERRIATGELASRRVGGHRLIAVHDLHHHQQGTA